MKVYRIGDFARSIGVTKDFLKFYHKKELLIPPWKDEKGYRYYASPQAVHLMEYSNLQKLGFSLEEADYLLSKADLEEYIDILGARNEAIEEEIRCLKNYQNTISKLTRELKSIQAEARWSVEEYPKHYFFEKEKIPLNESDWRNDSQIIHFWQRVTLFGTVNDSLALVKFKRDWGNLQNGAAKEEGACASSVFFGRCFVYCHKIKAVYDESGTYLTDKVWDFQEPLQILAKNKLKPDKHLYQQRLCVSHEESGDYVHVKTIIPLSE